MLASSFLDIAIGIIFIFLLLSVIASTVNEIILSKLNKRGEFLLRGLKTLLDDTTGTELVRLIYNHGQVFGLFEGDYDPNKPANLPAYIPANNFVTAFLGVLPEAPLAIATGLEEKAKKAIGVAEEAEKAAAKTNDSEDAENAKRFRDKATAATQAKAAADKTMNDAKAALDKLNSVAKGIELVTATAAAVQAAARADAAVKAAEEAKKVADANPGDTAAADKAAQLATKAQAATQEKVAAEGEKAQTDPNVQMVVAFGALKAVATELAKHEASEKVGKPLLEMLTQAENDFEKLKKSLESWYDSVMDRVSGWYKYHTQWWLLGIGLVLAIAVNADAVRIVAQLSKDSTLRQSIVAAAQSTSSPNADRDVPKPPGSDSTFKKVEQQIGDLHQLGIPLGWKGDFQDGLIAFPASADLWYWLGRWLAKVFGLLITAVAISMGAPFWFDLLNKFMVIRSTVKPREKSKEEGTKD